MSIQYATYPSLSGSTVIVSGGAEGIGAAIVEAFARQGSTVVFLDVADDAARELVAREPGKIHYYHCDLTDLDELRRITTIILSKHPKIDVLVNNAARDTRMRTDKVTPNFWDAQIAVNLRHVFFLTQAIVPSMQTAQSGSIINMGSISWAMPATGLPTYTTCKAAIMGLTRTHAHEFGKDGIRVNSIMPGGIATPRQQRDVYDVTPGYEEYIINHQALKMRLVPEDVARLALFLASADSRGITSQSYTVDAGWA